MNVNRFVKIILGRDQKFFDHFEMISGNAFAISLLLRQLCEATSIEERVALAIEIDKLEAHGDNLAHEIFRELSANFITPFDREDIHSLISSIDDVVDYINGSSKRIVMYKQQSISPAMQKLSELIHLASQGIHTAVCGLRNLKNNEPIIAAAKQIRIFENQADAVFYAEMSELFEQNKNGVEVLKIMEILQNLEFATDKCEDAAKAIESILMKNA